MDIGRAFGYVFEDERWISKLLLGAVITLIPIFGVLALSGYVVAVARNVLAGRERPLPEWDDLGQNFADGLMVWLANLVYSIPLIILSCLIALPVVLPLLAGDQEDLVAILAGISTLLVIGVGCLITLYGLLLWILAPAIFVQYAVHGSLGATLRFGEVFRFTFDNIGNVIIAQLMVILGGIVVGLAAGAVSSAVTLLSFLPVCGWIFGAVIGLLTIPLSVWLALLEGHLYGQVGLQAGLLPTAW
jgi:hypothetical protein